MAENYHRVSLLSVISKISEKLVNNRLVDPPKKCSIFCNFQYSFRSSCSTPDFLTVLLDRTVRDVNLGQCALDISKDLLEFCMLVSAITKAL